MQLHHARLTWAVAANAIVGGGRHPLLESSFSGQTESQVTPLLQKPSEHHRKITIHKTSSKKEIPSHSSNEHSKT
jgi:hypothetical protein